MQGQQRQTQQKRRRFPWIRTITALLITFLLSATAIVLILSIGHVFPGYWLVVIPVFFIVTGQLISLAQWMFPFSTGTKADTPSSPPTPFEVKVSLVPPIVEPATQNTHAMSSLSAQLEQRDRDVLLAIGRAVQAQQGSAEATKVTALLPLLEDRCSRQDIIDAIEWFHEVGYIQLYLVFGGTLVSSFHLTPLGKRKLALIR